MVIQSRKESSLKRPAEFWGMLSLKGKKVVGQVKAGTATATTTSATELAVALASVFAFMFA